MSEFKTPDLIQLTKKDKLSISSMGTPSIPESSDQATSAVETQDPKTGTIKSPQNDSGAENSKHSQGRSWFHALSVFTPPAPPPVKRESQPPSTYQVKGPEPRPPKPEDLLVQKEKYEKILSSLKYREPLGAAPVDPRYSLEVLKNGAIVDNVNFRDKRYFIVGRIPGCDILAENPTISRLHAILQFIDENYSGKEKQKKAELDSAAKDGDDDEGKIEEVETQVRDKGLYIYDLGSTHGTFLNKNRMYPNRFYRLRVGHVIKFGNSARLYVVNGPDDDEEEESEKTVTELMKEKLEKEFERKRIAEKLKEAGSGPLDRNVEEEGVSWGMAEDAEEETEMAENPFSMDFESIELNLDNPKKSLRSWFEREGYELEYDVREKAVGHYICRVDLPVDTPGNAKVFAEVEVKGKKKEAVHQCALQACQILDKYGVLRQSNRESRVKRKHRDWEEQDYYSSDEDTFLDRTGTVEKKREKRMREAGKIQQQTETFESLVEKDNAFQEEIGKLKSKIEKAERKMDQDNDEVDPLDAFMSDLKTGSSDLKKLKSKLRELVADQAKNKKLLDIARPALPNPSLTKPLPPSAAPSNTPVQKLDKVSSDSEVEAVVPSDSNASQVQVEVPVTSGRKSDLPLFGPRFQFKIASKPKLINQPSLPKPKPKENVNVNAKESPYVEGKKLITSFENVVEEDGDEDDTPFSDEESFTSKSGSRTTSSSSKQILSGKSATLAPDSDPDSDSDVDLSTVERKKPEDGTSCAGESKQVQKKKSNRNNRNGNNRKKDLKYEYDAEDPDYSVWVPPVGQKGDGRTSLNEKLGY